MASLNLNRLYSKISVTFKSDTSFKNELFIFIFPFKSFLNHYGFFFPKEDHLNLINVFLELLFTPDLDFPLVEHFSNILTQLLKKQEQLTRLDLTIDWRPVYELYLRINAINERSPILAPENMEQGIFNTFVKHARVYFPIESTSEMLEEWRPLMCPFDMAMCKAYERFELFLPTLVYPHEFDRGVNLWLKEFLDIWLSMHKTGSWDALAMSLFSRAAYHSIGYFDWNPYIPQIFNHILCGFGLPVAIGAAGNGGTPKPPNAQILSTQNIYSIAVWLVSMINRTTMCMDHIKRLFAMLRSFYYPSNTGRWSANLYMFLRLLPDVLSKRLYHEREKSKWYSCVPDDYKLNDDDITEFVDSMKDCVFTAIFSKTNSTDAMKAFQSLCFLRPELTLPHLLDKVYTSIESLTEPHRFTTILNCLSLVSRELVQYNKFCPSLQTHVIQLITAVLPGIDGNDMYKCLITFQFLSFVLGSVPIVNCSAAVNVVDGLNDHERELCLATENFDYFIQELFNKIFVLVEMLSSDLSDVRNTDELYIYMGLQGTVNAIVQQSSLSLIKTMINKMKNYIYGNVYNLKAGKVIASVCRELVKSSCGPLAFKTFFLPVYENLKRIRENSNFESVLTNERGDIELAWNLHLFSELVKADGTILLDYTSQVEECLIWFKKCKHKQTMQYVCWSIISFLRSLTMYYPTETRSTPQILDFDDPESFKAHLPTRDWGKHGDLHNLNLKFHEPNTAELKYALDFTLRYTNSILDFLKSDNSCLSKDERHMELCLLHGIIVGASRILKRADAPINQDFIETNVQIGVNDNIDILLLNKNSQLPKENVREIVIKFLLTYTDQLFDANTDDTRSFKVICKIFSVLSMLYGTSRNEFERKSKIFQSIKKKFENKTKGI